MEIGNKFSNLTYYNDCMKQSMNDKLFFLNKLPKSEKYMFVDFGCADGTMINFLTEAYAQTIYDYYFIGYDISSTMIDLAKTNYCGPSNANVTFTSSWEDVEKQLSNKFYKKVLILSSVIHEVYSYGDAESIKLFWHRVINSEFDYIVIRDMCPTKDIDRDAKKEYVDAIYASNATSLKYINDFQHTFGDLSNMKNLVHFLLKYRWKVNWVREVNENYFPIYFEDLINKITGNYQYNIDFIERFRVPFLDECIKNDFDIELEDFTHIKAVFSKHK